MRGRWRILLLAVVLTACGEDDLVAPPASVGTVPGVGVLPEALSRSPHLEVTTTSSSSTVPRPTVTVDRTELLSIGERVQGNRLIMIGDSILASTSRRYTGEMCLGLVPLNWAVEVDAEKSRFIDFGERVLNARLQPEAGVDWDVAAVFLGTNYGGDIEVYTRELDEILATPGAASDAAVHRHRVQAEPSRRQRGHPRNAGLLPQRADHRLGADDRGRSEPAVRRRVPPEPGGDLAPRARDGDRARWIADRQRRRLPEQPVHRRFRRDRPGQRRSNLQHDAAGGTRPRATTTTTGGGQTTVPQGGSTTTSPGRRARPTIPAVTTQPRSTTQPPVTTTAPVVTTRPGRRPSRLSRRCHPVAEGPPPLP